MGTNVPMKEGYPSFAPCRICVIISLSTAGIKSKSVDFSTNFQFYYDAVLGNNCHLTVKGEVAMRILLHLAALGALAAAEAAALQHGGIEGVGDLTLLTLALQSQGDHLIQQLGILHTHRLPQIEAEAAGDGVDLV